MALTRAIFLLCIAGAFAASLPDLSLEDFSAELDSLPKNYDFNVEKSEGQITEYDPISPSYIVSEDPQSNGYQVGKSVVEAILGVLQILRQMALSQDGLKNIPLLVSKLVSMFAGQYLETLKKLMPLLSGIAMAIIETLGST